MTYRDLHELVEPQVVSQTARYLRRLIIESPYIRARLHNPGGSILLMPTSDPGQVQYSGAIGNDAHLDLIEAEQVLGEDFSRGEQDTIMQWALGFTSAQAAEYSTVKPSAIRKRRERAIEKLETRLNGRIGGTGDGDTEAGGEGRSEQPQEAGDSGRETPEARAQAGDTAVTDRGKAA